MPVFFRLSFSLSASQIVRLISKRKLIIRNDLILFLFLPLISPYILVFVSQCFFFPLSLLPLSPSNEKKNHSNNASHGIVTYKFDVLDNYERPKAIIRRKKKVLENIIAYFVIKACCAHRVSSPSFSFDFFAHFFCVCALLAFSLFKTHSLQITVLFYLFLFIRICFFFSFVRNQLLW